MHRAATRLFVGLSLLALAALSVGATYVWPRDKRPPLYFGSALEKAEAAKPAGAFCTRVSIIVDPSEQWADWWFEYDVRPDRMASISVEMNGFTRATEHAQYRHAPATTRATTSDTTPDTTRDLTPATTRATTQPGTRGTTRATTRGTTRATTRWGTRGGTRGAGAATRPARGDANWPLGVPPPLSCAEAFKKAFFRAGDWRQVRYCTRAELRATPAQDGKEGFWRFEFYDSARQVAFEVRVEMNGRVSIRG